MFYFFALLLPSYAFVFALHLCSILLIPCSIPLSLIHIHTHTPYTTPHVRLSFTETTHSMYLYPLSSHLSLVFERLVFSLSLSYRCIGTTSEFQWTLGLYNLRMWMQILDCFMVRLCGVRCRVCGFGVSDHAYDECQYPSPYALAWRVERWTFASSIFDIMSEYIAIVLVSCTTWRREEREEQ